MWRINFTQNQLGYQNYLQFNLEQIPTIRSMILYKKINHIKTELVKKKWQLLGLNMLTFNWPCKERNKIQTDSTKDNKFLLQWTISTLRSMDQEFIFSFNSWRKLAFCFSFYHSSVLYRSFTIMSRVIDLPIQSVLWASLLDRLLYQAYLGMIQVCHWLNKEKSLMQLNYLIVLQI